MGWVNLLMCTILVKQEMKQETKRNHTNLVAKPNTWRSYLKTSILSDQLI